MELETMFGKYAVIPLVNTNSVAEFLSDIIYGECPLGAAKCGETHKSVLCAERGKDS